MKALKAHVRSGRLTLDEATTLPEGTVVDLGQIDHGDELDDRERDRLHEALRASWASAQAGQTISAEELLEHKVRLPRQRLPASFWKTRAPTLPGTRRSRSNSS